MIGVVADDLTGAGDASVQFARRGWDVFLSLENKYVSGSSRTVTGPTWTSDAVIAVTTDARALGNDIASTRTSDAVGALMTLGVDRLFVKVDSTMRGSVRGQVAGALSAWTTIYPEAHAVVCPAYPAMGRTVESNRVLVRGEAVETTVFGRDPVTPVTTGDMTQLLSVSPTLRVMDASTDSDLMEIASLISGAGSAAIAVGSGGLAGALAETWSPAKRTPKKRTIPRRKDLRALLQLSSLNPVSQAQVTRVSQVLPEVVILRPPAERGNSVAVAAALAAAFAERVEREHWDLLGLIGGDGARETLAQLGASGVRITDSLLEGIPYGIVVGGKADGVPVFTKAGGFGDEDALVRCIERMKG